MTTGCAGQIPARMGLVQAVVDKVQGEQPQTLGTDRVFLVVQEAGAVPCPDEVSFKESEDGLFFRVDLKVAVVFGCAAGAASPRTSSPTGRGQVSGASALKTHGLSGFTVMAVSLRASTGRRQPLSAGTGGRPLLGASVPARLGTSCTSRVLPRSPSRTCPRRRSARSLVGVDSLDAGFLVALGREGEQVAAVGEVGGGSGGVDGVDGSPGVPGAQ